MEICQEPQPPRYKAKTYEQSLTKYGQKSSARIFVCGVQKKFSSVGSRRNFRLWGPEEFSFAGSRRIFVCPFSEPLLRTLLRLVKPTAGPLLRTLLRTLPQNPFQNLLRTLLRTLCCRTTPWACTQLYVGVGVPK